MTTSSTLAINATNASFQAKLALERKLPSGYPIPQITLKSIIYRDVLYYILSFHSERAQPRMKGLKLKKITIS